MFEFVMTFVLVCVGYVVGSQREKQHYKSLHVREKTFQDIPIRAGNAVAKSAHKAELIMASTVIATDYFKTMAANIKNFIGGGINSQEVLMDRARREATVRLREKAASLKAHEILGFRMESSTLDKKGVEVFVYGTAVTYE